MWSKLVKAVQRKTRGAEAKKFSTPVTAEIRKAADELAEYLEWGTDPMNKFVLIDGKITLAIGGEKSNRVEYQLRRRGLQVVRPAKDRTERKNYGPWVLEQATPLDVVQAMSEWQLLQPSEILQVVQDQVHEFVTFAYHA